MEKIVFIIKIKDCKETKTIWENANNSYNKKGRGEDRKFGFYNIKTEIDKGYLKKEGIEKEVKGLILLITYNDTVIKDLHIGTCEVNKKLNLEYCMNRYIRQSDCNRTIEGIIDKLDLDLEKDFPKDSYIRISKMNSLISELKERLLPSKQSQKPKNIDFDKEKEYELHKLAQHNEQCIRIYNNMEPDKYRNEFQRDRERIVNSKAFRRMVDKAQIFGADKGDYFRTRMTHTLEVNQIAKAIAYALGLNLDLTEAIALAHDLGHTPFGHQGERTIENILNGKSRINFNTPTEFLEANCYGGFKHNYQSAKVLTKLEEKYIEHCGLDVSVQVIEGVLKHTKLKKCIDINDFITEDYSLNLNLEFEKGMCIPATLEGQVVAIADEIAQRGHDVDDALTSGLMTMDELLDRLDIEKYYSLRNKLKKTVDEVDRYCRIYIDKSELLIGRIISDIVGFFINECISFSKAVMDKAKDNKIDMNNKTKYIGFNSDIESINQYLEKIVQKKVICNTEVARCDYNASEIILKLFEAYYRNPRLLHKGTLHRIFAETLMHKDERVSNSAVDLNDCAIKIVNAEIEDICVNVICSEEKKKIDSAEKDEERSNLRNELLKIYEKRQKEMKLDDYIRFEKRKILIRNIVDYIAGMTDDYAISEYNRIK